MAPPIPPAHSVARTRAERVARVRPRSARLRQVSCHGSHWLQRLDADGVASSNGDALALISPNSPASDGRHREQFSRSSWPFQRHRGPLRVTRSHHSAWAAYDRATTTLGSSGSPCMERSTSDTYSDASTVPRSARRISAAKSACACCRCAAHCAIKIRHRKPGTRSMSAGNNVW
jgi:hypothetical protein